MAVRCPQRRRAHNIAKRIGGNYMKNKPLTYTFYLNGEKIDKLTEEQLDKMSENLSKAMSAYYTQHPEEYARLKI